MLRNAKNAALEDAGKSGEKIDLSAGVGEQKEALERVAAALDEVAEKMRQVSTTEQQGAAAASARYRCCGKQQEELPDKE